MFKPQCFTAASWLISNCKRWKTKRGQCWSFQDEATYPYPTNRVTSQPAHLCWLFRQTVESVWLKIFWISVDPVSQDFLADRSDWGFPCLPNIAQTESSVWVIGAVWRTFRAKLSRQFLVVGKHWARGRPVWKETWFTSKSQIQCMSFKMTAFAGKNVSAPILFFQGQPSRLR